MAGRIIMDSKKVLLWPVLISIIGHMALISVSGVIDLRDNVKAAEIITVDLKEAEPIIEPTKKEEEKEKKEVKKPKETKETKEAKAIGNGWREDTVDLSSGSAKYGAYLGKIKKKISEGWKYPPKAYERNEEGVVVIKISVDADGSVAQTLLLASSGSLLLDEGTLDVVRVIPRFDPLPDSYNLSRLNITVSFRYKLME
jgi:periplasmic protein TonB